MVYVRCQQYEFKSIRRIAVGLHWPHLLCCTPQDVKVCGNLTNEETLSGTVKNIVTVYRKARTSRCVERVSCLF